MDEVRKGPRFLINKTQLVQSAYRWYDTATQHSIDLDVHTSDSVVSDRVTTRAVARFIPGAVAADAAVIASGEVMSASAGSWVAGGIGSAAGSAAASVATQGIQVALDIQEKFSWNAVALAGIGGAVSVGVGRFAPRWMNGVSRAMASEAITQAIGAATGLQERFSWSAVAAAGVATWVGGKVGGRNANDARKAAAIAASTIARAATISLIDGTDFGDNMLAALPSALAQMMFMNGMAPGAESEAEGDAGEKAPYAALKMNVLNRAVSNSRPGHREWWDWLGMASDALGFTEADAMTTLTPVVRDSEDDVFTVGDYVITADLSRPAWERLSNQLPPYVPPITTDASRPAWTLHTNPQPWPTRTEVLAIEGSRGYSWNSGPTALELRAFQQDVRAVHRTALMAQSYFGTVSWGAARNLGAGEQTADFALVAGSAVEQTMGGVVGTPALAPRPQRYTAPAGARASFDRDPLPLLSRLGVEHSAMARARNYYTRL